jgi:hypothetical protein
LENKYKNLLKQLIPIPHFTRDNTGYFITYFPGYGARILNDHQRNQFFHVIESAMDFFEFQGRINQDIFE